MANSRPKRNWPFGSHSEWDVKNDLSDWLDWETAIEWLSRPDLVYWQLQYCLFTEY